MTSRRIESRILSEVHETARSLCRSGVISKRRMHEYDALCDLAVPALAADQIKLIREKSNLSQAVFAAVINTSVSTVQKWEIGEKSPGGASLKLLDLIDRKGIESVL